jgi:uncharacterized membrane protein
MHAEHQHADQPRRLQRLARIAVLAVALMVASFALAGPAQAATAAPTQSGVVTATSVVPLTGTSCGYGSSSGNTYTCMYVNGSGLFINYARASASVVNSGRTLQVCIRGPQGTIGCTVFTYVAPGNTLLLYWYPHSNEPAGNYCANTWRLNSDGSHTEIGHYCVNVHS